MEFRVLGPLEVVAGGQPLCLGTPRQRTLLALLLVRAGEVVSCGRLVEDLWDGNPPPTGRHTLQGYAHRLRQMLGRDAWRVQTRPPGYRLKVSAGELDAQRFQDLAGEGRRALVCGDPQVAAGRLAAALGLWRGPLLADLPEVAALEPERARLEALRLTALEDRVEAELALGGHATLVGELEAVLAEHPYRERLWGQLMLALYRSGQQADALQAFHRARQVLDEELGIQPSRWLCRRQEQILLQDTALNPPEPLPPPRPLHNLPAQRSSFVGRRHELAELQGLLQTHRLVCVTGPPGSGKTRLAVESLAGVANPFSLRRLEPGERVVDVGSGAGFDSFHAAWQVGDTGQVVGVDMIPEMLKKSRETAEALGLRRVEFCEGFAEQLPVEDSWADVVISNGVINLCADKRAVFEEIRRVLRPGGWLQFADIANGRPVPLEALRDIDLWTG